MLACSVICILNHTTILAWTRKTGINLFEDYKCKTFILCVVWLVVGFLGFLFVWVFFGWSWYFVTIVIFNNPAALVWKAFSVVSLVWMHVLLGVSLSFDPVIFIPRAYLNNVEEKLEHWYFLLVRKYLFHWHLLWIPCSTLGMPTVYMWKYFVFMF